MTDRKYCSILSTVFLAGSFASGPDNISGKILNLIFAVVWLIIGFLFFTD